MSDTKCDKDAEYLQELKRLRDHEARNGQLKKFLDSEILASEKRMKHQALLADRKQVLVRLEPLNELLEETSRTALRQDLVQMMLPLRKEVQRLTDEVAKLEMTKAQFRSRLVQCEEMLALLLFSLSDGSEFERGVAAAEAGDKASPWLMLCQAEAGLDAPQNGLPTTTLTTFAFDESRDYAKIYVDLPGLEESHKSKLRPTFSERHFSLLVADVQGTNYKIHFANLTEAVDVDNSKIRPKKDRLVVFLKKKQPITWRSLTSSNSNLKKNVNQKLTDDAKIKMSEFSSLLQKLMICGIGDRRQSLMAENRLYFVQDIASANHMLRVIEDLPPQYCTFQWRDWSPAGDQVLRRAVLAVARTDCLVAWIDDNPWAKKRRHFHDELNIITSGKCELAHFNGRLSKKTWSLLPAITYEVTAVVTCAEDARALTTCSSRIQELDVAIERQLPLGDLEPLPLVSMRPVLFTLQNLMDCDLEWLLSALDVLLPSKVLSNQERVRQVFRLSLPLCRMSIAGHAQLCVRLPFEAVGVTVHDTASCPHVRGLRQIYSMRGCAYTYYDAYAEQQLRDGII